MGGLDDPVPAIQRERALGTGGVGGEVGLAPLLEVGVEVAQQVGPIALDGEQAVRSSASPRPSAARTAKAAARPGWADAGRAGSESGCCR